jgi:hypothetical protein
MGVYRSLIQRAPKKNKYKNHTVTIDSIKFASRGEAQRYVELKELKKKGEILDFELQPSFILQPKYWKCCNQIYTTPLKKNKCPVCGKKIPVTRPIIYRADFRLTYPDGHQTIEDVKGWGGYTNPEFKLKRKMFEYIFPELTLEIVQRTGKGMAELDESPNTPEQPSTN